MNTQKLCQSCGTPLAADAPQGLCPACLMKVAMASGTDLGGQTPHFTPPTVAELAHKFSQLEILEFIGQGGMGAVYKARQRELDRIVALKILPPDVGRDAAFAERFTREAKALAKLNHPGIVTIHDFGRADGLYFFLMEYVDGVNLRQLLHGGRVSAREALAIVPQICDALQFAHDQGIIHRDIKPENILMDRRGRVKVADFGLAKIIGNQNEETTTGGERTTASTALTDASKAMGTPQYMSPEQIHAPGEVDHRADIYALGVVFYQMLTGELPGKKIEAPSHKVHIDVRLDEVVLRALEKNPELRYQQVSEVKTMVETIVGSSGRESAQTEAERVQTSQSRLTSAATNEAPRFSRTAIVGAIVCIFACLQIVWFYSVKLTVAIPPLMPGISWANRLLGMFGIWGSLFVVPLLATILGWISVTQIRRSAGKLHGLWLAVFDGLLFPLLAVDAVIAGFGMFILKVALMDHLMIPVCALLTLVTIVGIDWLIIRAVWRTLNKTAAPPVQKPDRFWRWFAVTAVSLTAALIFIAFIGLLAAIAIPNFVKARARAQENARLATQASDMETSTWKDQFRLKQIIAPGVTGSGAYGDTNFRYEVLFDNKSVALTVTYAKMTGAEYRVMIETKDGRKQELENKAHVTTIQLGDGQQQTVQEKLMLNRAEFEGIAALVLQMRNPAPPAAAPTPAFGPVIKRMANNPPFVARLNQAEVELVAVGNQPWSNTVCWLPNGQPSTEPFPTGYGSVYQSSDTMDVKKIAFRIHSDQPEAISAPVFRCDPASGASGGSSCSSGPDWRTHIGYLAQIVVCPKNTQQANLSIGIASGVWETAATLEHQNNLDGAEGDGDWSATWGAVVGSNGDVAINCTYAATSTNYETRMVAVDDAGKLTVIPKNSSSVSTLSTSGILLVSSNEFAHIKEFQLQKRRYQWAEFRNVSLQPGHITTVTVKDAGGENQAAQIMPASPVAAPKLAFGPVVERTLANDPNLGQSLLCLHDGSLVFMPPQIGAHAGADVVSNWWRATKADLAVAMVGKQLMISCVDVEGAKFAGLAAGKWEDASPTDVIEALQKGASHKPLVSGFDEIFLPKTNLLPATFAVKSRTGEVGLLQITGFTEHPRGVKLRYKLVESASNNSALPSEPTVTSISIPISAPSVGVDYTVTAGSTVDYTLSKSFDVSNATVSRALPPTSNLSFGPVIERTLYDYKPGKDWLLNLKTGETFPPPPGLNWEKNFGAIWDWAHAHGAHVAGLSEFSQHWHDGDPYPSIQTLTHGYGLPTAAKRGLFGFEMKAAIVPMEPGVNFESVTPFQIASAMQNQPLSPSRNSSGGPWLPQFASMAGHDAPWQGTNDYLYAFQTDDGQSGVLQITGFTDIPRGVKLRYKLVQPSNNGPAFTKPAVTSH